MFQIYYPTTESIKDLHSLKNIYQPKLKHTPNKYLTKTCNETNYVNNLQFYALTTSNSHLKPVKTF